MILMDVVVCYEWLFSMLWDEDWHLLVKRLGALLIE